MQSPSLPYPSSHDRTGPAIAKEIMNPESPITILLERIQALEKDLDNCVGSLSSRLRPFCTSHDPIATRPDTEEIGRKPLCVMEEVLQTIEHNLVRMIGTVNTLQHQLQV